MIAKISTLLVPPLPPAHQKLVDLVAEHDRNKAWEQLERDRAAAKSTDTESETTADDHDANG